MSFALSIREIHQRRPEGRLPGIIVIVHNSYSIHGLWSRRRWDMVGYWERASWVMGKGETCMMVKWILYTAIMEGGAGYWQSGK